MIINRIIGVLCLAFVALTISFCLINLIIGCESWSDPVCVTPGEFIGFFIP